MQRVEVRLECLRIAQLAGRDPGESIMRAKKYEEYVLEGIEQSAGDHAEVTDESKKRKATKKSVTQNL